MHKYHRYRKNYIFIHKTLEHWHIQVHYLYDNVFQHIILYILIGVTVSRYTSIYILIRHFRCTQVEEHQSIVATDIRRRRLNLTRLPSNKQEILVDVFLYGSIRGASEAIKVSHSILVRSVQSNPMRSRFTSFIQVHYHSTRKMSYNWYLIGGMHPAVYFAGYWVPPQDPI